MANKSGEPYLPPPSYETSSYYNSIGMPFPPNPQTPPPFPPQQTNERAPLIQNVSISIPPPLHTTDTMITSSIVSNQVICQQCFNRPATSRCDNCHKLICPSCITLSRRGNAVLHVCQPCAAYLIKKRRIMLVISSVIFIVFFVIGFTISFSITR